MPPRGLRKIKIKRPGALTAKAKKAGMSTRTFTNQVLAHPSNYSLLTRQQAQFARNFAYKKSRS